MIYFSKKADLELMQKLTSYFESIINIEEETLNHLRTKNTEYLSSMDMFQKIREEAYRICPEYVYLRTNFAKLIPKANEICEREKINFKISGITSLLEGRRSFEGSIFEFILNRPADLIDFNTIFRDTVNQIIGILEYKAKNEFKNLFNPFFWIKEFFVFIIRLPYSCLRISGFDVEKIQENLFARLFQLVYVIALLLILAYFGFGSVIDLKSLIFP